MHFEIHSSLVSFGEERRGTFLKERRAHLYEGLRRNPCWLEELALRSHPWSLSHLQVEGAYYRMEAHLLQEGCILRRGVHSL